MYFRFLTILAGLLSVAAGTYGQELGQRCKWIKEFNKPLLLDSLSVDAGSIRISADNHLAFSYDYTRGTIVVSPPSGLDSLEVCYQVYPFAFHKSYQKRTLAQYDSNALFKARTSLGALPVDHREQLFSSDQLYKSGSISRGISFGSNQNVFVNSNLNLQLEGKLTEDINIRASITDQNIPFQPEGNTQQLQDFDKVFIELYNDHITLSAGDVVFRHQGAAKGESYFMQYYKNVQGGQLTTRYDLMKGQARTSVGLSVAKGKFASIQVDPIEGVQGPYRVRGPNNERFIIVLANSEKVFLDGELLSRGFNEDYTIDYNLGEITFTSRVLITKFSRLRIDFEFSDQNYSKNILHAEHQQTWGRTTIFMNAYSEKDNRNRPLAFDLENTDLDILTAIGDNLSQAVVSGIDSIGFSENQVLYKKIDTVDVLGNNREILLFSTNPDSALFRAIFSEVGLGNGHYVQKNSTLNGRVFQWVGVDLDGNPRGNFEPISQVATPQQKRMYSLGLTYDVNQYDYVYSEVAFSKLDLNLYSSQDDEDNQGQAFRVGYVSKEKPVFDRYKLSSRLDYEYTAESFSSIDRFRYIEFDRDWSVSTKDLATGHRDHILSAHFQLAQDTDNQLQYRLVRRNRAEVVDGLQHYITLNKSLGRLLVISRLFSMGNNQPDRHSRWTRWSFDTRYATNWLTPGYQYQSDRNQVALLANDSIVASAMNFRSHRVYLQSNDTLGLRFLMDYEAREDRLPLGGILVDNNRSQTARLNLGTDIGKSQRLDLLFTYRNLQNLRAQQDAGREETINSRLDWQGNFLDGHIISEMNYMVGNGRELRREFIFLSVPAGEGTHTWRDENEDGIQDLNEFYIAINPDERNYAKIFTPTDEYILAYVNNFNYRLLLEMPRNWKTALGIKKLLSKLSLTTTWNIQRKLTDDRLGVRFSPFAKGILDGALISSREIFRATGFYNRAHAKYGLDFGLLLSQNKQLLTQGFEARDVEETHFNVRYSLAKPLILKIFTNRKTRQSRSDFLQSRNFTIKEHSWEPELSWQPGIKLRVTGRYRYAERMNIFSENQGESSRVNELGLIIRQSSVNKSTLQAEITFNDIDFTGVENTALGYELLQALRPGQNILWSASWQLKIASGLRLQLNYNGRKSQNSDMIHSGRMQISALF